MTKTLAFVHTAPVIAATFKKLIADIDPTIPTKHYVDEGLLRDARAHLELPQSWRGVFSTGLSRRWTRRLRW